MRLLKAFFVIPIVILSMSCSAQTDDRRSPKGKRGGPPSFKELLSQMDKDKDGKLAKSEVKGPLAKDFDKVDENRDGFITEEELKKAGPPRKRKE